MGAANEDVHEPAQNSDPPDPRAVGGEDRSSEAFRAACEARYVLAKPFAERRLYLEGVGRARGTDARIYLERVIHEEWKKKATPKSG